MWRRWRGRSCRPPASYPTGFFRGAVLTSPGFRVPLLHSVTGPERPSPVRETCGGPAATGSVVPLLESRGTGPEQPSPVRQTWGGPAATGAVVPPLESGTGPERASPGRETWGGPAATGSVVPLLESSGTG